MSMFPVATQNIAIDSQHHEIVDIRDRYIADVVQGKSFVEIGGLWGTVNEKVSVAHQFGARSLAMIDISHASDFLWNEFRDRLKEKCIDDYSLYSADVLSLNAELTEFHFDVIHCAGVIYHLPQPQSLISKLYDMSSEWVILTTAILNHDIHDPDLGTFHLPESGKVYVPDLHGIDKQIMKKYWDGYGVNVLGVTEEYNFIAPDYTPWWWILTPEAVKKMCENQGFSVVESSLTWNDNAVTIKLKKN